MSRQHNPIPPSQHERHYRDPFWGGWSPGYAGNYDSNYYYAPTQAQATTAQTRVKDYLTAVRKNVDVRPPTAISRSKRSSRRKISSKTTKKQADAKSAAAAGSTQLSNRWVPPNQLRCVIVFDTQSKQSVGSGCYVIGSLPPAGIKAKFDTFSTEFVGAPTLKRTEIGGLRLRIRHTAYSSYGGGPGVALPLIVRNFRGGHDRRELVSRSPHFANLLHWASPGRPEVFGGW